MDDLARTDARRPSCATDRTPTTGPSGFSARQDTRREIRARDETYRQPSEKRRALPVRAETGSQPPGRQHDPPARTAITTREAVEQGLDETIRAVSALVRATVGRASTGVVGRARANALTLSRSVSGSTQRVFVWGEGSIIIKMSWGPPSPVPTRRASPPSLTALETFYTGTTLVAPGRPPTTINRTLLPAAGGRPGSYP